MIDDYVASEDEVDSQIPNQFKDRPDLKYANRQNDDDLVSKLLSSVRIK